MLIAREQMEEERLVAPYSVCIYGVCVCVCLPESMHTHI